MARDYVRRSNGRKGFRASRYSTEISRHLRKFGYRPNLPDSVLHGITCRQAGNQVSVTLHIPDYPPAEMPERVQESVAEATEIAEHLRGLGYTVRQWEDENGKLTSKLIVKRAEWGQR